MLLTHCMEQNLDKPIVAKLVKKPLAFCGTRKFIPVFKTARHSDILMQST